MKATFGVTALTAGAALLFPVLLLGAESPFLAHSGLREICAYDADIAQCAQIGWQLILESVLSTQDRMTALWQNHARATMGGGIVLVGLMLMMRNQPRVAGIIGVIVLLLLISGIGIVANLDRQTIVSVVTQVGLLVFTTVAVTALSLGSLILFGMMLRGSSRSIVEAFVVRTAHSTEFPKSVDEDSDVTEQNLIGDIDGDTGSIRISRIYSDDEMNSRKLYKNVLVRLTWLNDNGRRQKTRSIYRRLDTLNGVSDKPEKNKKKDPKIPLKITKGTKPNRDDGQFPLCILHLQDRANLFGTERRKISDAQKAKFNVPGDSRDFAVLRIERAAFWNWFHYVFNHTDPAVAWSFRMGLVVSLFLMIVQITFLEPILSVGGFILN